MTEQERARQREYNRRFIEKHPDYHKQRLNKKYREDPEYREKAKQRQYKNYHKKIKE